MTSAYRRVNVAMMAGALAIAAYWIFFSEQVRVGNGFGWDGIDYARWARDFYGQIFVERVNGQQIQRIFTPALVHLGIRVFRLPLSDFNLSLGFKVLNSLGLLFIAWCWCRISDYFAMSPVAKLMGFTCLFINYAVLKALPYCPASNDTAAYAFGIGFLYFYWTGKNGALFFSLIPAMFLWPFPLFATGAILFLFHRVVLHQAGPAVPRFAAILAGLVSIAMSGVAVFSFIGGYEQYIPIWVYRRGLGASILILALYLFGALYRLCNYRELFSVKSWLSRICSRRFALLITVIAGVKGLQFVISKPASESLAQTYFALFAISSIVRPAIFLVAHVVYFGPAILLCAIFWKQICAFIHEQGMGLTLYTIAAVFFSVMSESRSAIINFFPLLVVAVAKVVDSRSWRAVHVLWFICLSLAWSKLWLVIHSRPDESLHLISQGPWMSGRAYLFQGSAMVLTVILLLPLVYAPGSPRQKYFRNSSE